MRKNKHHLFIFVLMFFSFALLACQSEHFVTSGEYINVNGQIYMKSEEIQEFSSDYEIDQAIGKVKKKISADQYPNKDFHSNYEPVGTEVFSIKGTDKMVVANHTVYRMISD
ncbi:hypothetical protein [Alkalihalobacillus sp. LMS39]|uniref:hypothetical protein n=1 Tax=Alkalihalobacillus sp. LMS39 TaxID=2924032 RepID=UPI001FB4B729|nr:hypothetical protein [Alkalihalobacillus sp. LMS39]UOE95822.1 hypothetical protein MM271_09565 [Alkalihalobacillus sp. LMS39]